MIKIKYCIFAICIALQLAISNANFSMPFSGFPTESLYKNLIAPYQKKYTTPPSNRISPKSNIPEPSVIKWTTECILFKMATQLNVAYEKRDGTFGAGLHNIPKDAVVNQVDCENMTMQIDWQITGVTQFMKLKFNKNITNYNLVYMQFNLNPIGADFTDAKENQNILLTYTGFEHLSIPLNKSFNCKFGENAVLNDYRHYKHLQNFIYMRELQFEAYRQAPGNSSTFSNSLDCAPSVNEFNSTCMLLKMAAQLNVTYELKDGNSTSVLFNIPNMQPAISSCHYQSLLYQWHNFRGSDNILLLNFNKTDNFYYMLQNISLILPIEVPDFPNAKDNQTLVMSTMKPVFNVRFNHSFQCSKPIIVELFDAFNNTQKIGFLNLTQLQMEAYRNTSSLVYSSPSFCDADDNSYIWPLGICMGLIAISLLVCISYAFIRCSEKSKYEPLIGEQIVEDEERPSTST